MTGRSEDAQRLENLPRWARLADYLSFVLLVVAGYAVVFGGISVEPFGVRFSAKSPLRPFVAALIIAAVRHWRYREPSAPAHAGIVLTRLRTQAPWMFPRYWPPSMASALPVGVASRLAVLLVGYIAVQSFGYSIDSLPAWRVSTDEWRNLPARWDSGWYLQIAQRGYEWNPKGGQQTLIFFPAYPMAMRGMAWIRGRDLTDPSELLWAGVLVSCMAFTMALAYLYRLARDQVGNTAARMTVVSLAAYPFALFYSAAYTESLYLLAAVATFFHFSRGQLWRAAAWGLLAGLTRPNGWMAGASLALMALPAVMSSLGLATLRERLARSWPPLATSGVSSALSRHRVVVLVAAAGAPGLGLLMYSAYTYSLTGHPFSWAHLMTYWGRDFNGLSLIGFELSELRALGPIRYIGTEPLTALNLMALVFGISSIWPVTRRLGVPYGVFVLVNIALPALSGGLESVGRYSSVLFPSFIWLGAVTPAPIRPTVVLLFALGQGLATALFFTWRSVF